MASEVSGLAYVGRLQGQQERPLGVGWQVDERGRSEALRRRPQRLALCLGSLVPGYSALTEGEQGQSDGHHGKDSDEQAEPSIGLLFELGLMRQSVALAGILAATFLGTGADEFLLDVRRGEIRRLAPRGDPVESGTADKKAGVAL